jgi:hypothetical protein
VGSNVKYFTCLLFHITVLWSRHIEACVFFLFSWGGVRLNPLRSSVTNWPIVRGPVGRWILRIWWNENWQGKPKYSEEACPSITLFTTNPTWLHPDSNPVAAVGSRRLTAWDMARLLKQVTLSFDFTWEIWLNTEDVNHFNAFFVLQIKPFKATRRLIVTHVNMYINVTWKIR